MCPAANSEVHDPMPSWAGAVGTVMKVAKNNAARGELAACARVLQRSASERWIVLSLRDVRLEHAVTAQVFVEAP
jgi:hypothetical protein